MNNEGEGIGREGGGEKEREDMVEIGREEGVGKEREEEVVRGGDEEEEGRLEKGDIEAVGGVNAPIYEDVPREDAGIGGIDFGMP